MTISERLFSAMKEKKITQEKLANHLGITQSTVGHWKTRNTTPPMEYLPFICNALEVSWEWLVTGENSGETYTREEKYLVSKYRNTNESGKTKILEYAQDMERIHPIQTEREANLGAKTG